MYGEVHFAYIVSKLSYRRKNYTITLQPTTVEYSFISQPYMEPFSFQYLKLILSTNVYFSTLACTCFLFVWIIMYIYTCDWSEPLFPSFTISVH
jgi:hypothetical protein